jgi:hypothetical protein
LLDGSLIITTEPGGGTTIEARLPLDRAAIAENAAERADLPHPGERFLNTVLQMNPGPENKG